MSRWETDGLKRNMTMAFQADADFCSVQPENSPHLSVRHSVCSWYPVCPVPALSASFVSFTNCPSFHRALYIIVWFLSRWLKSHEMIYVAAWVSVSGFYLPLTACHQRLSSLASAITVWAITEVTAYEYWDTDISFDCNCWIQGEHSDHLLFSNLYFRHTDPMQMTQY